MRRRTATGEAVSEQVENERESFLDTTFYLCYRAFLTSKATIISRIKHLIRSPLPLIW
jgi:hypothetical protein